MLLSLVRFAPKCRANLFPEQAVRSSIHFREDLLEKIFRGNEKRRPSGVIALSKAAKNRGVGSSSPLNKEKTSFCLHLKIGAQKKPETVVASGFSGAISFLVAQHGPDGNNGFEDTLIKLNF